MILMKMFFTKEKKEGGADFEKKKVDLYIYANCVFDLYGSTFYI